MLPSFSAGRIHPRSRGALSNMGQSFGGFGGAPPPPRPNACRRSSARPDAGSDWMSKVWMQMNNFVINESGYNQGAETQRDLRRHHGVQEGQRVRRRGRFGHRRVSRRRRRRRCCRCWRHCCHGRRTNVHQGSLIPGEHSEATKKPYFPFMHHLSPFKGLQ